MTDIKKIFQILFKRNILWISTLILIFLVIEGSSASYQASEGFISEMFFNFYDLDLIEIDKDKLVAPNYNDSLDNLDEYQEKYKAGFSDDYISLKVYKLNKMLEIMDISKADIAERENIFDEFNDENYEKFGDIYSIASRITSSLNNHYIVKDSLDGQYKLNYSSTIINPNAFIYIIILVIGILLLSGEHLTKYYEFSKMFPWTKTKTYLGKILFGFLIVMGVWLISIALKYAVFSNSTYKNITTLYEPMKIFLLNTFRLFAFYSIVMAVGALAGNFIGHIGLTIMALLGVRLYQYNITTLESLFSGNYDNSISERISSIIDNLNSMVLVIFSPIDGFILSNKNFSIIMGLVVLSLIFLILGIYWTKTAKAERSQMLVLKDRTSKFVEFMAILSTANIVQEIANSFDIGRLASIIIFFITLAIAYKFYQILFKSRVGFQS